MAHDTHKWKFNNGTHFYCQCNALGYTDKVLGVVSPVDTDTFVSCIDNRFDSYKEHPDLTSAQNHIMAIVALEADKNDNP